MKADGKLKYLIEVKAIGLDLRDSHVNQAVGYGAEAKGAAMMQNTPEQQRNADINAEQLKTLEKIENNTTGRGQL